MNEDIVVAIYQCLSVVIDEVESFYLRIQDMTLAEKINSDSVRLIGYQGSVLKNSLCIR